MRHHMLVPLALITPLFGCADGGSDTGADDSGSAGESEVNSCTDVTLTDYFPDATEAGDCTEGQGLVIASTLMNLEGITIDNLGEEMTPCLQVSCDSDYAYVVSNNIPHYDFVQLTPNALTESVGVHRIPLVVTAPAGTDAVDVDTLDGCETAYDAYVAGTGVVTPEPFGHCGDGYLTETDSDGTSTYAQLACLDEFALMNSGVVANGPNEGDVGVWGDPGLEPYNEWAEGPGASVDYCGGHTGGSMHYHAVYEECFETDEDQKPTMSYVAVGQSFSQLGLLTDTCTEPSGIVAWSLDGIPIKGPCVCTERADDGSCTTVKRARTSWLYSGFSNNAPDVDNPDASLSAELQSCTERDDCCDEYPCDFTCNYVVTDGDDAGSDVEQVCTFTRYAWCTREYVDQDEQDVSDQDFVYLDRCNAYEGADGLAYHTTAAFPYMQACYHGEPAEQSSLGGGGGPPDDGGGPPDDGGGPPDSGSPGGQ